MPKLVDVNTTVVLKCEFDLGITHLYSVKWYKDNNEFFRFMPKQWPQIQEFKVDGIRMDVSIKKVVRLNNTNLAGNVK